MTKKFNELLRGSIFLRLLGTILVGYGQVLICLNPLTGLFLAVAIFTLSPTVWALTLVGVLASTATAYLLRARSLHIHGGVYGFNGVVLGIAWLWFLRCNPLSILLLILAAGLSSALMKFFIDRNARTPTNLPVLSVPSVLVVWLLTLVTHIFFGGWESLGPDRRIADYVALYDVIASSPSHHLAVEVFFRLFLKYIVTVLVLSVGLWVHSRLSAVFALFSLGLTLAAIYVLGGISEFKNLEIYLYNAIPCGIALGGTFLVMNRRTWIYASVGVLTTVALTYGSLRYFPLPGFVAPFNLVAILFLWLVKSGLLGRQRGFYAVPMDLVWTPESGIAWYRGEEYARNYWKDMERAQPKQ